MESMGNIIDGGDGDANMEYIIKQTFVNFSCINAFKKLSKNLAVTQFWLVFQKLIHNIPRMEFLIIIIIKKNIIVRIRDEKNVVFQMKLHLSESFSHVRDYDWNGYHTYID